MTETTDRTQRTRRRVAITGMGVVAPAGIGVDAFWDGLLAEPPTGPRRIEDWDPTPWFDNPKEARRADRVQQFTLAAAAEALAMAGAPEGDLGVDPGRAGVWVATGIGGLETLEAQVLVQSTKGDRRVSPFLVPMMMANASGASVSMRYGWQGPCETIVTACAAGTHSITRAAEQVAWGNLDAVIAGGTESSMTPTAIAGFGNMTALSNRGVSSPFSADRDGFVIAEGCAVLVLEAWEVAEARGATILAEFLGGASTADAHHITAPAPGGSGAVRSMELALADAGITAADVAQVNAHGTSTPLNDAAEAHAMAKVFGTEGGPAVTSTKGVTGHALGAAGALEAAAAVLSIQRGIIPPTAVTEAVDPELPQLDLVVGGPREWTPGPVLSNSFGFGGHNGSLVIAPA